LITAWQNADLGKLAGDITCRDIKSTRSCLSTFEEIVRQKMDMRK
jgi:hypothetical protein